MMATSPPIPVYQTFAALTLPSSRWRRWFPFSAPRATWTFSGRVALYHGLQTLKLPAGGTILVPSYHQGVELDTLIAAGYRLRYYRVDERLAIDLIDAERQLDRTVAALYVTHYFGFSQPTAQARAFCDAHGLRLIEDCATSLFSRDGDRWLGSVGDIAIFSLYKTLPLPHGGFLVARGEHPAGPLASAPIGSTLVQTVDLVQQTLRAAGWEGVERGITAASRRLTRLVRWNRARTIQSGGALWDSRLLGRAASRSVLGLMRLVDPARVVARRRANFMRLAARLAPCMPCPFTDLPPGVCPLFFPVMVPDKVRFQAELAERGVGSINLWNRSHPTCPPRYAADVGHWRRHCLELPIHHELDDRAVDRVAAATLAVWDRHGPHRSVRLQPDGL